MSVGIKRSVLGLCAIALGLAIAPVAGNAQTKEDPVKIRRAAMKQMGGNMKGIGGFLKGGRRAGTADTVALRGQAIAAIAAKIPGFFPKGTSLEDGVGVTGAKPVIWAQWNDFKAAAANMAAKANKLSMVAENGDKAAIKAAMGDLGKKGCGGCHKTFRKKLKK